MECLPKGFSDDVLLGLPGSTRKRSAGLERLLGNRAFAFDPEGVIDSFGRAISRRRFQSRRSGCDRKSGKQQCVIPPRFQAPVPDVGTDQQPWGSACERRIQAAAISATAHPPVSKIRCVVWCGSGIGIAEIKDWV